MHAHHEKRTVSVSCVTCQSSILDALPLGDSERALSWIFYEEKWFHFEKIPLREKPLCDKLKIRFERRYQHVLSVLTFLEAWDVFLLSHFTPLNVADNCKRNSFRITSRSTTHETLRSLHLSWNNNAIFPNRTFASYAGLRLFQRLLLKYQCSVDQLLLWKYKREWLTK